jgi:polysaccharide deacetylase family protein (PEP-CTERM system associated)
MHLNGQLADSRQPLNVLSVDVEDYHNQLAVDFQDRIEPPTQEAEWCTERLLEIFSDSGAKGTFFILGEIAEAYPQLVRRIADEGHHLGIHGFHHLRIGQQTPQQFREAISAAKWLVEDLTGRQADAYRAPCFSLNETTLWALEILADLGFRYDSSIFPIQSRRYGMAAAPRLPFLYRLAGERTIWEVPLSTVEVGSRRLGACGGGFLRLFPLSYTRYAMRQLNQAGSPAIVYLHPYEVEPDPVIEPLPGMSWKQSLNFRFLNFHQCVGRKSVESKIRWLLKHHRFGTIEQLVGTLEPRKVEAPALAGASMA